METKFHFQAFKDNDIIGLSCRINDFVKMFQWKELTYYPTMGVQRGDGSIEYITSVSGIVYITK